MSKCSFSYSLALTIKFTGAVPENTTSPYLPHRSEEILRGGRGRGGRQSKCFERKVWSFWRGWVGRRGPK